MCWKYIAKLVIARWVGCIDGSLVMPRSLGAAVAQLQAVQTSGNMGYMKGQVNRTLELIEFISSSSSSSNNSNSENENLICHEKLLLGCYNCCSSAMQISGVCINVQRDVGILSESLLAESELSLQLKFEV